MNSNLPKLSLRERLATHAIVVLLKLLSRKNPSFKERVTSWFYKKLLKTLALIDRAEKRTAEITRSLVSSVRLAFSWVVDRIEEMEDRLLDFVEAALFNNVTKD